MSKWFGWAVVTLGLYIIIFFVLDLQIFGLAFVLLSMALREDILCWLEEKSYDAD